MTTIFKAMRVHQYFKNILIFIPLCLSIAAGLPVYHIEIIHFVMTFAAFSLLASSTYIINDILDVRYDRLHDTKKNRPIASGALGIPAAITLSILLFIISAMTLRYLPIKISYLFVIYVVTTLLYSVLMKKVALLDVITLAILYTIRVIIGMTLLQHIFSTWLLIFSFFFFLSLGFIKRYTEFNRVVKNNMDCKIYGRGYSAEDAELIKILGLISGYIAVLVFGIYLNSSAVQTLRLNNAILFLNLVVILYWISYVWMITLRHQMHDDPVIFAIKDKRTWVLIFSVFLIYMAARFL